jgi:hypothetical protein
MLDIDGRSIDIVFEDGFLPTLLRFVLVSLHVVVDHVDG